MLLQAGSCLYLDGNSYADMPPPHDDQFPNQMSVTIWFKSWFEYNAYMPKLFQCNNGGEPAFFISHLETTAIFGVVDTFFQIGNGFPSGVWVHYVWTMDKKIDLQGRAKWRIFKDGILVGKIIGHYPVPTHTCNIGSLLQDMRTPFHGKIDSFAFFPYILTSQDVQLLYKATGPVVRLA